MQINKIPYGLPCIVFGLKKVSENQFRVCSRVENNDGIVAVFDWLFRSDSI